MIIETIASRRSVRDFTGAPVDRALLDEILGPDVAAECTCIAMAHMDLQASSLGLGTCWARHFDTDQVRADFHIPSHLAIVAALAVGWPAESPSARPRIPSIEWSASSTGQD